jgi:hypothetical protein
MREGVERWTRGLCILALASTLGCRKSTPTPAPAAPVAAAAEAKSQPAPAAAPSAADKAATPSTHAKTPKPKMRALGDVGGTAADWAAVKRAAAGQGKIAVLPAAERSKNRRARRAARKARAAAPAATGPFHLHYGEPDDDVQRAFMTAFRTEQVFEQATAALNARVRINGTIDIELATCGEANAFYDDGRADPDAEPGDEPPSGPRITLCYEMMSEFLQMFSAETQDAHELGAEVVGAVYFMFFHELGHALRDNFKLPIVGREEDGVDQLATLLLLEMGDRGVVAALAAANAFALEQEQDDAEEGEDDLWDEHSMSGQRMYDMLCLIIGSNPKRHSDLVGEDGVPEERAERCPEDYKLAVAAWNTLLAPHLIGASSLRVALPDSEDVSAAGAVGARAAKPTGKAAKAPQHARTRPAAGAGTRPEPPAGDDDDDDDDDDH